MKLHYLKNEKLICVGKGGSIISMDISEILYMKNQKRILEIHCLDEMITIYEKFESVLVELSDNLLQCSRSVAVNMQYIRSINGSTVVLKNGESFPISRNRKKEVKQFFMDYLNQ